MEFLSVIGVRIINEENKNIHLERFVKYAVAFGIGMILGYIFVSYSMPRMGNKISLVLTYGYIVLSGYVGIPLAYNIILKVKDFILNAFSVFTFGLWFFIPISYSLILLIVNHRACVRYAH